MKFYLLKIHQYHAGEGYIGFWGSLGNSLEDAIENLKKSKNYGRLVKQGGLDIEESSMEELLEHFTHPYLAFEMDGDNYN